MILRDFGVDPDKGLLKHKMFWALVLVPVLSGLVLMVLSATYSGLLFNVDLSANGFNLFYSQFKFHLALMALSIPLGATYSRAHSSEQTADLIRQSVRKEDVELERNARRDFLEYMETYEGKYVPGLGGCEFTFDVLAQPLIAYGFFFARKSYVRSDDNRLLKAEELFELVKNLERCLNVRRSTANLEEYVNSRASSVCRLSFALEELAREIGVDHHPVTVRFHFDGSKYISNYFSSPEDGSDPPVGQRRALERVVMNSSNLAAAFYYGGQVVSLYSGEDGRLLHATARLLQAVSYVLEDQPKMVGLHELAALDVPLDNMEPNMIGMVREWCSFFPNFLEFPGRKMHLHTAMIEVNKAIKTAKAGGSGTKPQNAGSR